MVDAGSIFRHTRPVVIVPVADVSGVVNFADWVAETVVSRAVSSSIGRRFTIQRLPVLFTVGMTEPGAHI